MTDAGHEDRMLLALEPAAFVTEPEPIVEERARVPRSRNASYGRIIDHFLTKLEGFNDEQEAPEMAPFADRLYHEV
ncbi:MAG: hypothetical protein ACJLUP_20035 [Agrobacterium tumefaciens]|jgi:hypothetical protein